MGEALTVRSNSQQALDAAVLAGAILPYGSSDESRIAVAKQVYQSNGTIRANGKAELTTITLPVAQFTISDTEMHGVVPFKMQAPFLGILGAESLNMTIRSAAHTARGNVPVCVLGLD